MFYENRLEANERNNLSLKLQLKYNVTNTELIVTFPKFIKSNFKTEAWLWFIGSYKNVVHKVMGQLIVLPTVISLFMVRGKLCKDMPRT